MTVATNSGGKLSFIPWILLIVGGINLFLTVLIQKGWKFLSGEVAVYTGIQINAAIFYASIFGILPIGLWFLSLYHLKKGKIQSKKVQISMGIFAGLMIAIIYFFSIFYMTKQFFMPTLWASFPILVMIVTILGAIGLFIWRKKIPFKGYLLDFTQFRAKIIAIVLIIIVVLPYMMLIYSHPRIGDTLPPKPGIIAHRGAASLAPENTLIAGEKALEFPIIGWEVDVVLTADGVPIINHDSSSFTRTSNIRDVFPDRAGDAPETFTLAEVKQLDVGSWFVERDPYGTIAAGKVSDAWVTRYRGAQIPTLEEVLNFTVQHDLLLYLDIKTLQGTSPYADQFFEIVIDTILASGIDLNHIQIEQIDAERYALLEAKGATAIQCAIGLGPFGSAQAFQNAPYEADFVTSADTATNYAHRSYESNDIPVLVWTIDDPERFQELWLLGVDWVMTDDLEALSTVTEPGWQLSVGLYILICVGLNGLIVLEFVYLQLMKKGKSNSK